MTTPRMKMEAVRRCWTAIHGGKEKQSVLKNIVKMGSDRILPPVPEIR